MRTLYDSETFSVTHMLANAAEVAERENRIESAESTGEPRVLPAMPRHGFEIVDKRAGKEVYLDGSWAELFQQQIAAWQASTPTQEEVEDTLEGYATLAQNPVVTH